MAAHGKRGNDCRRTGPALAVALAVIAILGCETAPPPLPVPPPGPAAVPVPAPAAPPVAVSSPAPVPVPAAPAPPAPAPAPASTATAPARADTIARYERTAFANLPATADSDWIAMWPAFLQSCQALAAHPAWKDVCARATGIDRRSPTAIRRFFAAGFDAYRIRAVGPPEAKGNDLRDRGLVTGYYEPLLKGSRKPSAKYPVPLYRVPPDLVPIDLAGTHPELAGLRLRGRMQNGKIVAYPTRGEIMRSNLLRGHELLWVDDPIDAFFLQVQGSGRVQLDDGGIARIAYADTNGHPYRSIGRWLVDTGELTLDQASMQGIKAWAALNPKRLNELLGQNPSFVFFRELPLGDPAAGPKGALGVPLTPHASLAADARFIPLGAPLLLASVNPATGKPFVRPMVAQDTGSAIRGPLRFDYFWGFGAEAGERAGRHKHEGSAWLLVPRGVSPESLVRR